MQVNQIKIVIEQREIDILGITLLSIEEYTRCLAAIPELNEFWWLRTPGYLNDHQVLAAANYDYKYGFNVGNLLGVRPVLEVDAPGFVVRDKFEWRDYTWTMISTTFALCDVCIDEQAFRKDWEHAENANVYAYSDIKKYLHDWIGENEISQEIEEPEVESES